MLTFLLLANQQGNIRLSRYWRRLEEDHARNTESEIVRKCLTRSMNQCSFLEYKDLKIVYRKYATLYFIAGATRDENEMSVFEFIQFFVETLTKHFEKVCELDIMFNLDKVHMILDEIVMNGCIIETNKNRVLAPVQMLEHQINR